MAKRALLITQEQIDRLYKGKALRESGEAVNGLPEIEVLQGEDESPAEKASHLGVSSGFRAKVLPSDLTNNGNNETVNVDKLFPNQSPTTNNIITTARKTYPTLNKQNTIFGATYRDGRITGEGVLFTKKDIMEMKRENLVKEGKIFTKEEFTKIFLS